MEFGSRWHLLPLLFLAHGCQAAAVPTSRLGAGAIAAAAATVVAAAPPAWALSPGAALMPGIGGNSWQPQATPETLSDVEALLLKDAAELESLLAVSGALGGLPSSATAARQLPSGPVPAAMSGPAAGSPQAAAQQRHQEPEPLRFAGAPVADPRLLPVLPPRPSDFDPRNFAVASEPLGQAVGGIPPMMQQQAMYGGRSVAALPQASAYSQRPPDADPRDFAAASLQQQGLLSGGGSLPPETGTLGGGRLWLQQQRQQQGLPAPFSTFDSRVAAPLPQMLSYGQRLPAEAAPQGPATATASGRQPLPSEQEMAMALLQGLQQVRQHQLAVPSAQAQQDLHMEARMAEQRARELQQEAAARSEQVRLLARQQEVPPQSSPPQLATQSRGPPPVALQQSGARDASGQYYSVSIHRDTLRLVGVAFVAAVAAAMLCNYKVRFERRAKDIGAAAQQQQQRLVQNDSRLPRLSQGAGASRQQQPAVAPPSRRAPPAARGASPVESFTRVPSPPYVGPRAAPVAAPHGVRDDSDDDR